MAKTAVAGFVALLALTACNGRNGGSHRRDPSGSWDLPKLNSQYGQQSPTHEDVIGICWNLELPATRIKPLPADPGSCRR